MLSHDTPRLARVVLALTVASFVVVLLRYGLGVTSPVWPWAWERAYNLTQLLGAVACALRAATASRAERRAWAALTIGLLGFAAADVYWTVALSAMASPPFPSRADVGYLGIYPASFAAVVLLLRARAGRVPASLWMDGLIGALAVAALGAALVFGVVAVTDGSLSTVATNLAYPLGDLTLLAFVIAVLTVTGWRPGRAWLLMALGFAVFAVGDTIYLYETARGIYEENTLLDATWPAFYVLVAFAAWQPPKALDARRLHGGGTLVIPSALALLSLGMLVFDHYARLNSLALWLAAASLAVVVARFGVSFLQNLRLLRVSEAHAMTDPLTGLGNRRALLGGLDRAFADGAHDGVRLLALFDLDGFKAYNDVFGHPAGDALLERLGARLAASLDGGGSAYRMGGDEFCVLAAPGRDGAQALVARAAAALSEHGESFEITCSHGMVMLDAESGDPADALRLADQRMYAHKRGGRPTSEETIHQVLLRVVGAHDGSLRDHVDDVARLAEPVARRLGLAGMELAHVRRAAALHDIGKVAIPDAILHAPRALTPDEWQFMRQHTVIGARIIAAAPELLPVAANVRSSHERYDGAGYPDGLAGDDIPLGARIIAVCDAYDAMTTDRAYRAALTREQAITELERCAGGQFDARVVAAFVAVLDDPAEAATAGDGLRLMA
jgi:diguanylate cyclase (GGDEF)-like protein/putative nucleotidyltransferase with HDIG domain